MYSKYVAFADEQMCTSYRNIINYNVFLLLYFALYGLVSFLLFCCI